MHTQPSHGLPLSSVLGDLSQLSGHRCWCGAVKGPSGPKRDGCLVSWGNFPELPDLPD